MKRLLLIALLISFFVLILVNIPNDDTSDVVGTSDFDLFAEFRMGTFDPAGVQGYDFVDEDAGGIGERFPADRGAIYITDNSFIKEQGGRK